MDGDESLNFFKEIQVHAAPAFLVADFFALAAAQVPGFIAADIEKGAGEMGQEFAIQVAEEGDGSGVVGSEGGGTADKFAAGVFVGVRYFGKGMMLKPFEDATYQISNAPDVCRFVASAHD